MILRERQFRRKIGPLYLTPTPSHIGFYLPHFISAGACVMRDHCIAGQISPEEFMRRYKTLKDRGFAQIIEHGAAVYELIG